MADGSTRASGGRRATGGSNRRAASNAHVSVSNKALTLSGRSQLAPFNSQSIILPQEDLHHSLDAK